MRCAYHSEVDAIGVCVNCGKAVCVECKTVLGGKIYCPGCAEEIFVGRKKRTGLLTAGGILSIIGGAFSLIGGIGTIASIPFLVAVPQIGVAPIQILNSILIVIGVWLLALGGVAIAGGIHALRRKRWGLSLAGAICAFLTTFIFGLLAIIFVAVRREEFGSIQGGEK